MCYLGPMVVGIIRQVKATGIRRGKCPILNCYHFAAFRFLEKRPGRGLFIVVFALTDSTLSKSPCVIRHTNEHGSTTERRTRCSMFY
jgi:hypothetical protein